LAAPISDHRTVGQDGREGSNGTKRGGIRWEKSRGHDEEKAAFEEVNLREVLKRKNIRCAGVERKSNSQKAPRRKR